MYPPTILRCQHLKINGTQCGSPALRNERYCYFHHESNQTFLTVDDKPRARQRVRPRPVHVQLPLLEDANSIQVALMQIMRLVLAGEIEHRTAGLLLYALQTASANLAQTSFEPEKLTSVVIDQDTVASTPLAATQWSLRGPGQHDDDETHPQQGDEDPDVLAKILLERMGLEDDEDVQENASRNACSQPLSSLGFRRDSAGISPTRQDTPARSGLPPEQS